MGRKLQQSHKQNVIFGDLHKLHLNHDHPEILQDTKKKHNKETNINEVSKQPHA
jgi:hypothetical protein